MNFALTEEQLEFQKMIREFAQKEFEAGAIQRDEDEDFKTIYDSFINKMGPMGLLGLTIPKEYGGQEKSPIFFALSLFELCRVEVSVGAALSVCLSLGSFPLVKWGTEEQKKKFLPPLARGEKLCAFALTEDNAGSDSAMQETTAELQGDEYILNGNKIYITNGGYAETYIVIAMTDKSKGTRGISAFIVEKGTPGFRFGKSFKKMGIRATAQRELIFENCRIPKKNLIGKEGEGFKIAMATLDVGRIGVASQGVGAAMGAFDLAAKHSKERVQFGKAISANQGVSFMLAEMATKIELAQMITLKAAWLMEEGLPYTSEAAMAKLYATDIAMEVTTDSVQILGGKGFLRENGAERFMRDAKILQIYEGTNEIQKMIIAGSVLREY